MFKSIFFLNLYLQILGLEYFSYNITIRKKKPPIIINISFLKKKDKTNIKSSI